MQHTVNAQMVNAAEYGVNAKFECNQNAGAMQHIKNACAMQHMAKIECNLYAVCELSNAWQCVDMHSNACECT